ncbi:MAG TPA: 16S rRNA (guanine(966)-N(2))-methyltransferase RsmD [Bacteroidales bacterium]|nr:16S rRNA (guanine(966)-N(2))-methyltransferase RsmD [Bacteroidales bacterium]HBZ21262.1 16S rRNA (guanine(966)-N(2))-methyltransferase RsmD [Bacteroidales bacterium]
MRIIGGKYKGRIISPISGLKARPTTDFARESLFNILNNRVDFESISVLDLFSGTGSIGFEFDSRGAKVIHLVEKDSKHIAGIKQTIDKIGFTNIKPIHIDVKTYLKACRYKYDIVFADPPYDLGWLKSIPDLVLESMILKEEGFIILEHPRSMDFKKHNNFFEHRSYGNVNFSFFRTDSPLDHW